MRRPFSLLLVAVALATGCASTPRAPRDVVVWVSIDGLRPDYVTAEDAPFLHGLAEHAAFTRELEPPFPSLTFPSHTTQATGVGADRHGIVGNGFWDSALGRAFEFPDDSSLVEAEPIWTTAERQGCRAAVVDWPMSYRQRGRWRASAFDRRFEKKETDDQRLARAIDALQRERLPSLLLVYVVGTDPPGHHSGPASDDVRKAMRETDARLARFFARVRGTFAARMTERDHLHVLFTTDHGMAPVRTRVDFDRLLPHALPPEVRVSRGSTLASLFFDAVPAERRSALEQEVVDALASSDVATAYRRRDLPARWEFAHPTRVGDVVVVAKPGVVFTKDERRSDDGDVRGMHGYDPAVCPDMLGFAILWSSGTSEPIDLGRVNARQLHPTIARLLGIEPSPLATAPPLDLARRTKNAAARSNERTAAP